jgi:predicted SnoaL-like aldol condensation-catalyzing enzyme
VLKASGLGFTIIRPNSFLQNILAYIAPSIRTQGQFYSATGVARFSYLDIRDIAKVAAKIMMAPSAHAGRVYELNGPEPLTNSALAERISRVAGRHVQCVDIPEEAQRELMMGLGMPTWQVEALLELQRYYTGGQGGAVTDTLRNLLGTEPRTIDRFLEEFKDAFAAVDPMTGMTQLEAKQFVRNHFEEFVNRKNLDVADVNFAAGFVDHGADVPPGLPPGPAGAKAYVGAAMKRVPDLRVDILDLIAEGDKVVVRNHWMGTEALTGRKIQFSGIVIWRVQHRQLVERWAYLTPITAQ